MTINDWTKEIHENAVDHGWWEEERSLPEIVALCHSELSEALEEYRDGNPDVWYGCHQGRNGGICLAEECQHCDCGQCVIGCSNDKPEGIAVEMADCIIRILDYAGHMGWDMEAIIRQKHEYNKTRPYRHGGKVV